MFLRNRIVIICSLILIIGGLLVVFTQKQSAPSSSIDTPNTPVITPVPATTPAQVQENYKTELMALQGRVEVSEDISKALTDAEQTFLKLHVPAEHRDTHLAAFMKIHAWVGKPEQATRDGLVQLLRDLILQL